MVSTFSSHLTRGGSTATTKDERRRAFKNISITGPDPEGRYSEIPSMEPGPDMLPTRLLGPESAPHLQGSALAMRHDLPCIPPLGRSGMQWGTPERIWDWRLSGLECGPELFHLYQKNRKLAELYEGAIRDFVDSADPAARRDFEADMCKMGRKVVYDAENIMLELEAEPTYSGRGPDFPQHIKDILGRPELFDIITHGHLRENLVHTFFGDRYLDALKQESTIYISSSGHNGRVGEPVCMVALVTEQLMDSLFLKVSSLRPDIFAADLFRGTGVIIPNMANMSYFHPNCYYEDYGLLRHLGSGEGIISGAPINHLRREPKLTARLRWGGMRDMAEKLGHAFELCRMRGIQDRHPGNVWLLLKQDLSLSIGMIDLDLVGCYPYETEKYQGEFASRLRSIALDLHRAFHENNKDDEGRRADEMIDILSNGFLAGALRASHEDMARENRIRGYFAGNDGNPVGIYIRPIYILQTFEHVNGWPVTFNPINGPERQKLFVSTSNSGRIIFNAKDAWEHGYLRQRAILPELFWKQVLDRALDVGSNSVVY